MDVRDHGIRIRSEAIGMLRSGVTQQNVALDMDVLLKSVKRWWSTYKKGESLETKTRSGRPPILNRVMKIVISKSMGKGRQSTRNIARRLNTDSNPVFHMTIYRYLKNCRRFSVQEAKNPSFICKKHPRPTQFCQETSKLEGRRLEKINEKG